MKPDELGAPDWFSDVDNPYLHAIYAPTMHNSTLNMSPMGYESRPIESRRHPHARSPHPRDTEEPNPLPRRRAYRVSGGKRDALPRGSRGRTLGTDTGLAEAAGAKGGSGLPRQPPVTLEVKALRAKQALFYAVLGFMNWKYPKPKANNR